MLNRVIQPPTPESSSASSDSALSPQSSVLHRSLVLSPKSLDLLFLLLLAAYILIGTPLAPFHGDESTLIYESHDYGYIVHSGNLDLVRFHIDPPEPALQYLRLIDGSIVRYTIGLGWSAAGYTLDDLNSQWDWAAGWDYNVSANHMPAPDLLLASRWPNALLLALSVVPLFAIGVVIGGRPVAYLASLYYALNPAILVNGRRAMMESSMLLFGFLTILAGVWYLRRPSWRRALLLGVAAGFALAAKHSNAALVGAVVLACLLYPLVVRLTRHSEAGHGRSPSRATLLLPCVVASAAAVFILLNPVWWGQDLKEHLRLVVQLRSSLLSDQVAIYGGYVDPLDRLAGGFRQGFVVLPQYLEDPAFAAPLADQIAAYGASLWRGVSLGGSTAGGLVMLALTLTGVTAFVRHRALPISTRLLLGLWALASAFLTFILTPLEWQRYYVPLYPLVALFAALGLIRLASNRLPPDVWRGTRR